MKNIILFLIVLVGLSSCRKDPTDSSISDRFKPADKFARGFFHNLVNGELDSCYAKIDAEKLDDSVKSFIRNANVALDGLDLIEYKIVDQNQSAGITTNGNFVNYHLGYEYNTFRGYILFTTTISSKDDKFSILKFGARELPAPLAELTKFKLTGKSVTQYVFLAFSVLVPLFIVATLLVMLKSNITRRRKIIWSLIILFVALPKFTINWTTGQIDYQLFTLTMFGAGSGQASLFSDWIVYFSLPLGAIRYWRKRKNMEPALDTQELYDSYTIVDEPTSAELPGEETKNHE